MAGIVGGVLVESFRGLAAVWRHLGRVVLGLHETSRTSFGGGPPVLAVAGFNVRKFRPKTAHIIMN